MAGPIDFVGFSFGHKLLPPSSKRRTCDWQLPSGICNCICIRSVGQRGMPENSARGGWVISVHISAAQWGFTRQHPPTPTPSVAWPTKLWPSAPIRASSNLVTRPQRTQILKKKHKKLKKKFKTLETFGRRFNTIGKSVHPFVTSHPK